MFEVNEDMIVYAFRYALGRKTYAVGTVSDFLIENWHRFKTHTKERIIDEITEALNQGNAGMQMDEDMWERILLLETATKDAHEPDCEPTNADGIKKELHKDYGKD